jgi:cytochrome c556
MRKSIVFAALAALCAVVSCGNSGNGNAPAPDAAPPASWDDQSNREWRHRSQYKTHMRHMWIDSNRIVTAGRGDAVPSWAEIWSAAEDIGRRATLIGGFWRDVDERSATILECAQERDRIGAAEEFRALGAACDGCHMATWSPAYMHVTDHILDGWLQNNPTTGVPEEMDKNPPPLIPNRTAMQKLYFDYQVLELHIESWRVEKMPENINAMREQAQKRAERWEGIAAKAKELVGLAKDKKREGMREAYSAMTAYCLNCHGEYVAEPRTILIPMPWDGP